MQIAKATSTSVIVINIRIEKQMDELIRDSKLNIGEICWIQFQFGERIRGGMMKIEERESWDVQVDLVLIFKGGYCVCLFRGS